MTVAAHVPPTEPHSWRDVDTVRTEVEDLSPVSHADCYLYTLVVLVQSCACGAIRRVGIGRENEREGSLMTDPFGDRISVVQEPAGRERLREAGHAPMPPEGGDLRITYRASEVIALGNRRYDEGWTAALVHDRPSGWLRDALEEYGRHHDECASLRPFGARFGDCDCGFRAVLSGSSNPEAVRLREALLDIEERLRGPVYRMRGDIAVIVNAALTEAERPAEAT